jgi:hypothetical protein
MSGKLKWLGALLVALSAANSVAAVGNYTVPVGSPGYQHGNSTMRIQFDDRTLFVDGERVFIYGGEFHPWRLPVPELWSDVLQKMKVGVMDNLHTSELTIPSSRLLALLLCPFMSTGVLLSKRKAASTGTTTVRLRPSTKSPSVLASM